MLSHCTETLFSNVYVRHPHLYLNILYRWKRMHDSVVVLVGSFEAFQGFPNSCWSLEWNKKMNEWYRQVYCVNCLTLGDQQWWASLLTPSKCLHVTHSPKLWVRQWRPFSIWFELMGKKWAIFLYLQKCYCYFGTLSIIQQQIPKQSSPVHARLDVPVWQV